MSEKIDLDKILLVKVTKTAIIPLMKLNTKCKIPIQLIEFKYKPLYLRNMIYISEDFWTAMEEVSSSKVVDDDLTEKGAMKAIGADKKEIIWTTSRKAMRIMYEFSPGTYLMHIS